MYSLSPTSAVVPSNTVLAITDYRIMNGLCIALIILERVIAGICDISALAILAVKKEKVMKKTILVAEDYDDSRSLMRFILEGYGYRTLEAVNGQEAVEIAQQFHPDLILMDISMPVMDGFTATQLIRKCDGMSRLPIIAVTSLDKSYYRQAIEAGCDDLINKPVDSKALQPILNQYLGH